MKQLKNNIYKNIASILISDKNGFRSANNIVLFSRIVQTYPSKSIHCLVINRILSFFEKNVYSVSLIVDIMKNEDEDEEIVSTIEFLYNNPSITNLQEVNKLCTILCDYLKFSKILKVKNTFLSTLDLIDEDDDTNLKNNIDTLYKLSNEIIVGYNTANVSSNVNTFDTKNKDVMRNVVAQTFDDRSPDKVIITSIRALNMLLSPGYMSGCIYVYAGLPGNYKSGILLTGHVDCCKYNQHIRNVISGKTPISMYISMENTMSQTVNRLWSVLFPNTSMSMYSVDEVVDMIDNELTSQGFRSVILYYGYREKSTADVAQIIRSYNDDENEVVALYLDYIKRIRPARTDAAATASEKSELNAIMNEIKSLICAQFNIPCITGHQLNRQAATAVDSLIASGGFNKTDEALGRSQVSVA